MGLLDNVIGSAVPGGDLAKPIGAALLGLLAYKATGGNFSGSAAAVPASDAAAQSGDMAPQPSPGGQGLGGLLSGIAGSFLGQGGVGLPDHQVPGLVTGGLSGLLQQFQQRGYGDIIKSWIGGGPNQPIQPDQLHQALGSETVDALARQTGMSQHDLVSQLAQALPQFIDRMTPQGRIPSQGEMARWT